MFPEPLQPGDTVGLISPSGSLYEEAPYWQAVQLLQSQGFKVQCGRYWQAKWGYLAGTDEQRLADLHAMFANPEIKAIIAFRGGWGAARLLPYIDFKLIAANPKILLGYSDVTTLLLAVHAKTGLVTWHGAVARDLGDDFTLERFGNLLCRQLSVPTENSVLLHHADMTAPEQHFRVIQSGSTSGKLLGGNLTVLCSLVGSCYLPDWHGAILFLEDVGEATYRIDRMLCQLKLAGILDALAGVVLGAFTHCPEGKGEYSRRLDDIFHDYFLPLGIPVFAGAQFGHIQRKVLLPIGAHVYMNADTGVLKLI